jgi:hypothetical protein
MVLYRFVNETDMGVGVELLSHKAIFLNLRNASANRILKL